MSIQAVREIAMEQRKNSLPILGIWTDKQKAAAWRDIATYVR